MDLPVDVGASTEADARGQWVINIRPHVRGGCISDYVLRTRLIAVVHGRGPDDAIQSASVNTKRVRKPGAYRAEQIVVRERCRCLGRTLKHRASGPPAVGQA